MIPGVAGSVVTEESSVRGVGQPEEAEQREGQFQSALKLFEMGQVTTAQAAGMCGMASVDFLLAAERANQRGRASISTAG
jgi:hypothetical protein